MIIIPLFLSLFVSGIIMFFMIGIILMGSTKYTNESENEFEYIVEWLDELPYDWVDDPQLEDIIKDLNMFNLIEDRQTIYLYEDEKPVYIRGRSAEATLLDLALAQSNDNYYDIDEIFMHTIEAGKYRILFTDLGNMRESWHDSEEWNNTMSNSLLLLLFTVIFIILVTNRLLTKMVIDKIVNPLETLVYGVHKIRDGNLSYRINYDGKDEFSAVCSDFNEMAARLQDMVDARQKDNESRRELIAGISHDLRTPLTSIKGYVIGLEEGIDSTPEIRKRYLDTIKNKTEDIEHIVKQLFLFSKMDLGEFPLYMVDMDLGLELSDFIDEVKEEYQKKGLEFVITENCRDIIVSADKVQLRNVYINLFENTVKYSDKEEKVMEIACRKQNNNMIIVMTDNGPGVSEESLDKLFEIFYRGDKARNNVGRASGSGLGLAISAKIIESMGGTIGVANGEHGGLAVTITLPYKKGKI